MKERIGEVEFLRKDPRISLPLAHSDPFHMRVGRKLFERKRLLHQAEAESVNNPAKTRRGSAAGTIWGLSVKGACSLGIRPTTDIASKGDLVVWREVRFHMAPDSN